MPQDYKIWYEHDLSPLILSLWLLCDMAESEIRATVKISIGGVSLARDFTSPACVQHPANTLGVPLCQIFARGEVHITPKIPIRVQ